MRILFMGTPDFAVASLKALAQTEQVIGVITQPDKPQGRKMVLTPPAVKVEAEQLSIPVFQPETLRGHAILPLLEVLKPELIVVAAYGKLLPQYVLRFPALGCINVHGSLLPKYRGAAPIQWSVINGDEVTGITTMIMARGIDTGDMLLQKKLTIGEYETSGELYERMAQLGAATLLETIALIKNRMITGTLQNEEEATYAPMLSKEMAAIDFTKSAESVSKLICGLHPWPIAQTKYKGKTLKIVHAVKGEHTSLAPGYAVQTVDKGGIEVGCGDGKAIVLTEVQLEGSRVMSAKEFLVGRPILTPVRLGAERIEND